MNLRSQCLVAAVSPTSPGLLFVGSPFVTSSISLLMDLFELLIHYSFNFIVHAHLEIHSFLQCFQFLGMVSRSGCLGELVPFSSLLGVCWLAVLDMTNTYLACLVHLLILGNMFFSSTIHIFNGLASCHSPGDTQDHWVNASWKHCELPRGNENAQTCLPTGKTELDIPKMGTHWGVFEKWEGAACL